MTGSRDALPLRFKNPRTKEALRRLSEESKIPMTEIAEAAIEHELTLLGADLERRLEEALALVRAYRPEDDLESYLGEIGEGERSQSDPVRLRRADRPDDVELGDDRFGVLAAFRQ